MDLVKGLTITGRLSCTTPWTNGRVYARGPAIDLPGVVASDGTFEIKGVPPGRWRVDGSASIPGRGVHGSAEVDAGGSAEISLE